MVSRDRRAEQHWREHAGASGPAYLEAYWNTWGEAHRIEVLEACESLGPFSTLLDLGCHCGPFLELLQLSRPQVHGWGLEISPEAATFGNIRLGWGRSRIVTASFLTLRQLGLRPFDVLTATYALAYVAPQDLPGLLVDMLRLSRVGIVLAEPTTGWTSGRSKLVSAKLAPWGEWLHNYSGQFTALGFKPEVSSLQSPKGRLNTLIVVRKGEPE